jgi:predicted patatin/cPLA2 family phospholipase
MTDPAAAPVGSAGKPADLVLEGGGVKGIGLAGAVLALDQAGYRFQRVAGTSAGADQRQKLYENGQQAALRWVAELAEQKA